MNAKSQDSRTEARAQPAPEAIVSKGEFEYGRYSTLFRRANMLDISRPYHYPVPRFIKNWRLKEWQAFRFGDERWFFVAALYNEKTFSMAVFQAWDRLEKRRYGFRRILPGSVFSFPDSLGSSRVAYRGARNFLQLACDCDQGGVHIEVVRGCREFGRRFSGRFSFPCGAKVAAPNVVCLPLGMNRAMYSTKLLMPMEGEFLVGGDTFRFESPGSMGVMDDHKGYYPMAMRYDWVSGFGLDPKGRKVGFNLTDNQVRDQVQYNENCIWINNRLWPLPPVKVTRPHGHTGDWIVQDTEGLVDLVFKPEAQNNVAFRLGFLETDYHGPFGSFDGVLKNGEGEKIQADLLRGMGEQHYLRS